MIEFTYNPPMDPLVIAYQDAQIIVVDKPSGLLSVPGKTVGRRDCVELRLRAMHPESLLVHRLDCDTSGVIPNCFVLSHAQSGMSANFPHMLGEQARHLAHIVSSCLERGVRTVEATAEAEAAWVETILAQSEIRRKFLENCTPGYYNNEGRASSVADRNASYGAGPVAFIQLLRDWREAGTFDGLELDGAHASPNSESHS